MTDPLTIKVGHTQAACVVQLDGRATMHESPTFQAFFTETLKNSDSMIILDLTPCEYLDSTFLGCLVFAHKKFGVQTPSRFVIHTSEEVTKQLLSPMGLDQYFAFTEGSLEFPEKWSELPIAEKDTEDFRQHILECHQRLADLEGPQAAIFGKIADQLMKELDG